MDEPLDATMEDALPTLPEDVLLLARARRRGRSGGNSSGGCGAGAGCSCGDDRCSSCGCAWLDRSRGACAAATIGDRSPFLIAPFFVRA
jgi:hypothetical protein